MIVTKFPTLESFPTARGIAEKIAIECIRQLDIRDYEKISVLAEARHRVNNMPDNIAAIFRKVNKPFKEHIKAERNLIENITEKVSVTGLMLRDVEIEWFVRKDM